VRRLAQELHARLHDAERADRQAGQR
jgi:hypothetical protein